MVILNPPIDPTDLDEHEFFIEYGLIHIMSNARMLRAKEKGELTEEEYLDYCMAQKDNWLNSYYEEQRNDSV